ncbi:MAG TPA: GGDEF domain-containing protein [Myxococcota bacterium]|jgi:diguanylate cyclase (GGDEF)-like protein|nr:GGDEF domain-containing protein [Myxococcota bacterium]
MPPNRNDEDPGERTMVSMPVATPRPGDSTSRALLVVLSGPAIGHTYTVGPEPVLLGRGEGCEVLIPDPGISRQHARVELRADKFFVVDLGSTNGTLVDGVRIKDAEPLREGNRIQLGSRSIIKFSYMDSLEAAVQQRLNDAIHADGLTGARNRRYLDTRLRDEFAFATRHGRPLCLLMLDVDHFKQVNDRHGHPVGDVVLRALAEALMRQVRQEDVVVRYGGEEFLILARGITHGQGLQFGERMRGYVQNMTIPHGDGQQLRITISVGVATLRNGLDGDPSALIARADAALYQAKQKGRNRVEGAA